MHIELVFPSLHFAFVATPDARHERRSWATALDSMPDLAGSSRFLTHGWYRPIFYFLIQDLSLCNLSSLMFAVTVHDQSLYDLDLATERICPNNCLCFDLGYSRDQPYLRYQQDPRCRENPSGVRLEFAFSFQESYPCEARVQSTLEFPSLFFASSATSPKDTRWFLLIRMLYRLLPRPVPRDVDGVPGRPNLQENKQKVINNHT